MEKKNNNESFLYGALCYFWVLSVVFIILKKEDSFVKFHAKQGLLLFFASFLTWIPLIGWLVGIALFMAAVAGFIKALQGEKYRLPIIYDLGEKINL